MKSALIIFPGTTGERDVAMAIKKSTGNLPEVVWHGSSTIPEVDLIILPGGVSYGSYLRGGAIAARSSRVIGPLLDKIEKGVQVLGIGDGFQILTEIGALPGRILLNQGARNISIWVNLRVENIKTSFTGSLGQGQIIKLPIAGKFGRYYADERTVKALNDKSRVVLRYADLQGNVGSSACPNGSSDNIAAITNKDKNVVGIIPHPDRAIDRSCGGGDGKTMFDCVKFCL
jgi:phosphoribosylformylglycinamidine synthase